MRALSQRRPGATECGPTIWAMVSQTPPPVRLGALVDDGIAPSVYALVERGATRRPDLARAARGVVELRFDEDLAAVRIHFGEREILVEDVGAGGGERP